jgi:hypothetical protein
MFSGLSIYLNLYLALFLILSYLLFIIAYLFIMYIFFNQTNDLKHTIKTLRIFHLYLFGVEDS